MFELVKALLGTLATGFAAVASAYVAAYYLSQIAMLLGAWMELRRQRRRRHPWQPRQVVENPSLPGITVVVPAFNEERSIARTVRSILDADYPELEVIVVNDGSTDGTLDQLRRQFDLFAVTDRAAMALDSQPIRQLLRSRRWPRLSVIDKKNGGKADALNAGIDRAAHELVCAVDADVLLDRWALFHLVRPFLDDRRTVAASGMIRLASGRLADGCRQDDGRVVERRLARGWLERFQVLEYLRAFAVGRMFFNRFDGHVIISGAFGLFRRRELVEIGGYHPFSIGEDMELVVRLHRHLRAAGRTYRIRFVADAICYTEAPHSIGELGRQRTRWHQGLLTTLRVHRGMLLRRRFGVVGLAVLPYYLLFELLAPLVELAGWLLLPVSWWLGMVAAPLMGVFMAVAVLLGTAASLLALAIDVAELRFLTRPADVFTLAAVAALENFGYHHLTLFFRCRAFPHFYRQLHLRGGWRPPQRA